ncbi:uncharacterized protein LOC142972446 [Anticarsia gemmatalis]|uniref:uncharacterized protein LOC142972446 n=1 Tax=Anticarsia gemmatalis TaxID=129554 RepID=UPI003F759424
MKREDSQCGPSKGGRGSRPARLLTDSISSDEGPETECLLTAQLQAVVVSPVTRRRESLTAPPSPTESRKKRDHHRQHNYKNHLHHLIHWRDIWSGEPNKGHEVFGNWVLFNGPAFFI